MKIPTIAARDRRPVWILAAAVLFAGAGFALGSALSIHFGLVSVAVALRLRSEPAVWEYVCFLVLALAGVAWSASFGSTTSPLPGAILLMLSYVLNYLDEWTQRRAVRSMADLAGGRGPAAPDAPPNENATRA